MNLKQYIVWLTSYRDSLIEFSISRWNNLHTDLQSKDKAAKPDQDADMPIYISSTVQLNILAEVQLCNRYLEYLYAWDDYYSNYRGPSENLIKTLDEILYKNLSRDQIRRNVLNFLHPNKPNI